MQATCMLIFIFIGFCQCSRKNPNPDENAGVADRSLFEGDIILNSRQRMAIKLGLDLDGAIGRAAAANRNLLWPSGVLPYTIDSTIYGDRTAYYAILNAMRVWNHRTCIVFKRRTSERDYVHFFKGSGCSSMVGRQGGRQQISIGRGCGTVGIVAHEIAHALGFWHEQSRPDRDNYVTINLANVRSGYQHNFNKYSTSRINSLGVPYDYGSVMHYGAYYFSKNGQPTIVVKKAGVTIGQRSGPSELDFQQMNLLYKCPCNDKRPNCGYWALRGECTKNPAYMNRNCCVWCNHVRKLQRISKTSCTNKTYFCHYWANQGQCCRNPAYMLDYCCLTCKAKGYTTP